MKRLPLMKMVLAGAALKVATHAGPAMACAMCYGAKTDSPLAEGMNWGIMSLLAVVGCVLSGFAAFGVFLVKKSAAVSAASSPASPAPTTEPTPNDLI